MTRRDQGLGYVLVPAQRCRRKVIGDDLMERRCSGVYIGRQEGKDYFDCGCSYESVDVAVTPEVAKQLGYDN